MLRKILLFLFIILIAIQFMRPAKNITSKEQVNAIEKSYSVPADIKLILDKACKDCHSNNTKYPWYNKMQPVAWWLNNHITDAKKHLNFDEFLTYAPKRQDHKMEEVLEQVDEGHMPLNSYTWVHTDARLNDEEKNKILNWAKEIRKEISIKTGFVPERK